MPKLLPNRISRKRDDAETKAISDNLKALEALLAPFVQITEHDYEKLPKIAELSKRRCDALFDLLPDHVGYLEKNQSLAEIEKDKVYYEQLMSLKKGLETLLEKIKREASIAGAEYRNGVGVFEANVRYKVKLEDQDALLLLDQINRIDDALDKATAKNAEPASKSLKKTDKPV